MIDQFKLYYQILNKFKITIVLLFIFSIFFPIKNIYLPYLVSSLNFFKKKTMGSHILKFGFVFITIYLAILVYEYILIYLVKINLKEHILSYFYKKIFFFANKIAVINYCSEKTLCLCNSLLLPSN
mgnify:CR=1 FL=1